MARKPTKSGTSRGSRALRWLLAIAFVALVAVATHRLWLSALGGYLVEAEPPVHADIIVVLAGDFTGGRILTSADLVRRGFAPKALVSGPAGAYGQHESDLAIPFATRHGYPESYFIAMPHEARSTVAEAEVIIPELRRRHAHKIQLVTSNYHTRRAWKDFRSRAQDLEFHMAEAPDRDFSVDGWWKTRDGRKVFLNEWMKTVATWVGM